jgi:uncharacterized protein (DUF2236 family)
MSWTVRPAPTRDRWLQQIELLDVECDFEAIYRLTVMRDLAWESRFGWNLAFYRPFAVPRMAALLTHTGQLQNQTLKRAHDTGLMMYELFEHGLDHPRSREVIRRLNRMHQRWEIEPDDYRYILTTFAVVPTRFTARYGWRPLTEVEHDATFRFYRALGERMAITTIPDSYPAMATYLDDYEAREVRHSLDGERLAALTLPFLATRVPGPLKSRAGEIAGTFLDPRLREALGLPTPRRSTVLLLHSALAARRVSVRRKSPTEGSWFTPGMAGAAHPEGYKLSDLGPPE